jgi:hypothetical protein
MLGAEFACKPWRRVALEEPSLWRRIGMDPGDPFDKRWRRVHCHCSGEKQMSLVALDRAKGQCEAYKGYCHDEDLCSISWKGKN